MNNLTISKLKNFIKIEGINMTGPLSRQKSLLSTIIILVIKMLFIVLYNKA